ncbi:MAG: FHA domain-containing protein [Gammaproteobacteria bacterium]|nr:FHA domain-containing protein [Gammaproteobacteria bacterium]MCW8924155.1 FHA domain-containing protein [Gammaproteobacteria bacterium]
MIKLKHILNRVVISEIDMTEGDYTIGRNPGNSLQLDDSVISGEHAQIKFEPNDCIPEMFDITITDLGSTNGTYVNNEPIKEQKLKHGDSIRIGTHEFKVFDDQSHTGTQTEYYIAEDE